LLNAGFFYAEFELKTASKKPAFAKTASKIRLFTVLLSQLGLHKVNKVNKVSGEIGLFWVIRIA